ncbi:uncharacterized protein LOC130749375 [Lotus japonicus]|uniref:uncharacterized protein LOC130749375 n=1 Tax=Lotus japonicus TaxID=34305 RepID=UPI00258A6FFC|nr:uncharacterized protein LOC130749375 [Lotus japonicus]
MYFEEFFNDHHHNNHNCSMSLSVVASSSHIVSDATSLVEKKIPSGEHVEELSSLNENDKRSSFKRRRNIIEALVDEALEDTATSCLNSPKEKGNTSGQKEGRKELMSFNNERDSDRTAEQQKRDLCVVP